MVTSLFPIQYLIAALTLWLNRQQQDVIDDLKDKRTDCSRPNSEIEISNSPMLNVATWRSVPKQWAVRLPATGVTGISA